MVTHPDSDQPETQMVTPLPREMGRVSRSELSFNRLNLLLCGFGAVLHLFAYLSLLPMVLAGLFYGAVYLVLVLTRLGGHYERQTFTRVFAVGLVAAGVAAIYVSYFHDAGQLYSDAGGFFEIASGQAQGLPLIELQLMHQGSLAIVLWAAVYDFFAMLGFPRERYVGILVNVTAVALTAVITLKMARLVYGDDPYRFKRLTLLFSACGLFWLFAGIHIRDSIVLLAVTLLGYAWLQFLSCPSLGLHLLKISGASLLAGLYLGFLRGEFMFVPVAMAMAGVAALLFSRKDKRNRSVAYGLVLIGLAAIAGLFLSFGEAISFALSRGSEGYAELAVEQHGETSLGMALIVNQVLPIRLVLGTLSMFFFPVPFWAGFQLESAYHLFKSVNAIFMYFFIPLLLLAVWQLWKKNENRSASLIFLLFLSSGLTAGIAGTSAETRHLGAFFPPIFLVALLPDLRAKAVRSNYKKLLIVLLGGVFLVHYSWIIIKGGPVYLTLLPLFLSLAAAGLVTQKSHRYLLLLLALIIALYLLASVLN